MCLKRKRKQALSIHEHIISYYKQCNETRNTTLISLLQIIFEAKHQNTKIKIIQIYGFLCIDIEYYRCVLYYTEIIFCTPI